MNLLITGTGSGFGRHLHETLGGIAWKRGQSNTSGAEIIIHSAWPSRPPETDGDLAAYVESTLGLTRKLVELPHQKFVFVSTAEVYPMVGHSGSEDQPIQLATVRNLYAYSKLMAEAIVRERSRNFLILRTTGLLGLTARSNSLIRILTEPDCALTLSAGSRFYYILHEDVGAFCRMAIERNLSGVYNVCSSQSVTLGELARQFGRKVNWGAYTYNVGNVANQKISAVCPAFQKTSIEVVSEFVSRHHPALRLEG